MLHDAGFWLATAMVVSIPLCGLVGYIEHKYYSPVAKYKRMRKAHRRSLGV